MQQIGVGCLVLGVASLFVAIVVINPIVYAIAAPTGLVLTVSGLVLVVRGGGL